MDRGWRATPLTIMRRDSRCINEERSSLPIWVCAKPSSNRKERRYENGHGKPLWQALSSRLRASSESGDFTVGMASVRGAPWTGNPPGWAVVREVCGALLGDDRVVVSRATDRTRLGGWHGRRRCFDSTDACRGPTSSGLGMAPTAHQANHEEHMPAPSASAWHPFGLRQSARAPDRSGFHSARGSVCLR